MEQLTKNQAVATSQEAVQNQNEPQLRDENAHNDKSVHGVLNPTYQAGLRRDAVQPDIEAERKKSFFFQAEDGIRGRDVTGVQTCALPISDRSRRRSRCRRSRHDLNGGEFRVVDTCRSDNVEHSVCDRDNERSLHRGKLSGYRPDIKILENSLPFYADIKHTLPGGVEIYFSKVERDRVRVVNDWDVVRERWRIAYRLIQRWVRCSGN